MHETLREPVLLRALKAPTGFLRGSGRLPGANLSPFSLRPTCCQAVALLIAHDTQLLAMFDAMTLKPLLMACKAGPTSGSHVLACAHRWVDGETTWPSPSPPIQTGGRHLKSNLWHWVKTLSISPNQRANCDNRLQFAELKHNVRVRVSSSAQVR